MGAGAARLRPFSDPCGGGSGRDTVDTSPEEQGDVMTTAETKARTPAEIARELFEERLNARDADALREYWAEDVVEDFPTGTVSGREAMRDYFAEAFAAMPDFHITADKIVAEGETVFVKWRMTGTFKGAPWQGIEPTGDRIELDGMDCFTIRDGLVVGNFVRYDQMSFARQVGMMPAQGSGAERAMTAAFNAKTKLQRRLRERNA
jgi:predicted ester cyclase